MIRWALIPFVLFAGTAYAAEPTPMPWEQDVRQAIVHVESVWAYRLGVLVGDGNTVWSYAGEKDRARTITVNVPGEPEVEAEGWVYHDGPRLMWTLKPEKSLGHQGLTVSMKSVEPGSTVYTLGKSHKYKVEHDPMVRVLVASTEPHAFTLAAESGELRPGAPVVDGDGHLLGILTSGRRVVPAYVMSDNSHFMERCAGVQKIFGIRAGAEIQGALGGDSTQNRLFGIDSDVATIFELDFGVALWDRLGIVGSVGFAVGDTDDHLTAVEAADGLGSGVVSTSGGKAVRLGLELQYRQLLHASALPIYVDFAAGGLFNDELIEANGPLLRSTDPACNPSSQACPLVVQDGGDIDNAHTFDLRVGVDFRFGPLLVGYRFLPGFGDAVQAHQITIGLQGP